MQLFVQLRNRGENEREHQRRDASGGDNRTQEGSFASNEAQAHFVADCASGAGVAQARSPPRLTGHSAFDGLPMRIMIGPAKIYFIIFGLLTIVGGVIGYVKAGSTISIVSGAIAGIALIVAAFLLPGNAALGLIIAGIVSVLLAGRFIPHFMQSGKIMPDALISALSAIGVVVAIVAWIKK